VRSFWKTLTLGAVVAICAGGHGFAAPPVKTLSPVGTRFDAAGKVTLHPGKPCAPPIMFDFRMSKPRRSLSLAARMAESRMLTEAARQRRTVRIWGTWKRGLAPDCYYVNVTRVEIVKGWKFPFGW
jgi:hypothetical protein